MHDYVVAISHRDGDHVGSVKVSAASASDAADAGILTMLDDGRRCVERLPAIAVPLRQLAPAPHGPSGSAGRPTA
ncbi:hypothetical protein GS640_01925, partial [Rhodococcus hoagii]|nr:hypothetical protein [Prescottella equi]